MELKKPEQQPGRTSAGKHRAVMNSSPIPPLAVGTEASLGLSAFFEWRYVWQRPFH
jgi:hypothetical protein